MRQLFLLWLLQSVSDCLCSPILCQSATNGMSKSMSHPKMAAPGEALSNVWEVEQITHAALSRKTSTSLGVTDSARSISAVCSICLRTWCMRSNIAFVCGFLTTVGLGFIPYNLHRYSKCSLNSFLLAYIEWQHRGYLHNQVSFTNLAIWSEVLSKISSAVSSSLLLTVCLCNQVTTCSSTISNQLEAGLIMVRAIKSICKLSLPLKVYGPIRLTHNTHGLLMTVLDGTVSHLFFIWQALQDLVIDRMVVCMPFQ